MQSPKEFIKPYLKRINEKTRRLSDEIMWFSPATSPYFPTVWPPSPQTHWQCYATVLGQPSGGMIMDAAYISKPWARLTRFEGNFTIEMLTETIEKRPEMQNMWPIDERESKLYNQQDRINAYLFQLDDPAKLQASESFVTIEFYRMWMRHQQDSLPYIAPFHPGFFDWIRHDS